MIDGDRYVDGGVHSCSNADLLVDEKLAADESFRIFVTLSNDVLRQLETYFANADSLLVSQLRFALRILGALDVVRRRDIPTLRRFARRRLAVDGHDPKTEALRLLHEADGRVCLKLTRRPDGSVVTADGRPRTPGTPTRRSRWTRVAAAAS